VKKRTQFYDDRDAPAPIRVKKQVLTTIEITPDGLVESSIERLFDAGGMREQFKWRRMPEQKKP